MELASIIVPVYNTEKYLRECIESIINQSYSNIQLILVDDGSVDSSYSICKDYEDKYSFIELHHQENKGVSAARNEGLKHIRGKYVFFVDSDDVIKTDFIKVFMDIPECDFVGAGYQEYGDNPWKLEFEEYYTTIDNYKKNYRNCFNKIPSVHVAGNRYLSNIISNNNLWFDETCKIGEDSRFNINYFSYCYDARAITGTNYIYRIRNDSSLHIFQVDRLVYEREECKLKECFSTIGDEFNWIKWIHWFAALEHYYTHVKGINKKEARRKLKETMNDEYFKTCSKYLLKYGTLDMKTCIICMRFNSYSLYKGFLSILKQIKR